MEKITLTIDYILDGRREIEQYVDCSLKDCKHCWLSDCPQFNDPIY